MAKFVLLLVLVCFQFSSQQELGKLENELVKEETLEKAPEPLDGADENQWQPDVKPEESDDDWTEEDEKWLQQILDLLKESDEEKDKDEDSSDEWTEEDEKWLQQILDLLKESDEDYEDDSEEFDKLMEELDQYFGKSDEYDSDEWFKEENWDIDLEHYPDYFEKQENGNLVVKDDLDLYYTWLYRLQIKKERSKRRQQHLKRFTSV